ncbi:helix-turn-helix domain-containing protein [Halobellus rufus]|uniref:helix-turn-helix domain-containing protein n=1 Tax=Halobellus rufus TaxID=1448860 RepID=UPI0006788C7A|nr:helix-turn-helix domain-containing protein [Halobellus rufus]
MSVVLEFTIDAEEFAFGSVLATVGDLSFELEQIVPTGLEVMPFIWASTNQDLTEVLSKFEQRIRDSDLVRELHSLDRLEDGTLYRIEWGNCSDDGLLTALKTAEATILDAWGKQTWNFRVRFVDGDCLTKFHDVLRESGVTIDVERTHLVTEDSTRRWNFGLTPEEREALTLALQWGYFETPSQTDLAELGDELDITKQSVSGRLRRGNQKILQQTLHPSGSD